MDVDTHESLARYEDVLWLRLRENGALQTDRTVPL